MKKLVLRTMTPILMTAALALAGEDATKGHAVMLNDAAGKSVGTAVLSEAAAGVVIEAALVNLSPGRHGFHIHEKGLCEAPFKTAGGHWNPGNKKHGFASPEGAHDGDLPNVLADKAGTAEVEVFVPGAKLADLLDADGSSLVVHAKADDLKTDPAGDAGDRIACGVLK